MEYNELTCLKDLNKFRSAPRIDSAQSKLLIRELELYMSKADWFTVGIMASSYATAINIIRSMEKKFNWEQMNIISLPTETGPVFLKANQRTGEIHIRIEFGLGEGILISCQYNNDNLSTNTFGPFPINFFDI